MTLLVATEMAAGSDDSAWAGLSVSGCVTLGPTCLGTLIRFWQDLDAREESANVIRGRDAGEVAVSLDVPFSRGRLAFRPGVELGVGWVHMGGFGGHSQMVGDNDFDHGDVSAGPPHGRGVSGVGGTGRSKRARCQRLAVRAPSAVRHRRRDAPGRAACLRAGFARPSLRSPMNENSRDRKGKLVPLRRVDGLPTEMSDEGLLAACALGDRAALGALYDRLSPHVWRFLSRVASNQIEELEDLVQATFIAVHASAATFKGTALVRTWVFAIAANVTRRYVRDEVRRRSAFDRLARVPALPPVGPTNRSSSSNS